MKTIPVLRLKVPAYPTRLQILADPALLERHIPPAWRATADLAKAAALFLATNLAGCGGKGDGGAAGGGTAGKSPPPAVSAIVAPVFEHGDGRGATGCVAVSPPCFLSEEEAIQAIAEEMARAGAPPSRRGVPWKEVSIPHRHIEYHDITQTTGWQIYDGVSRHVLRPLNLEKLEPSLAKLFVDSSCAWPWRIVVDPVASTPLTVDGLDPARRIAFKFVSEKEYFKLGGPQDSSTGGSFDTQETARWVASQVKKHGPGGTYFGTFYDPAAGWGWEVDPTDQESFDKKMKDAKGDNERRALWVEHIEKATRPARQQSLQLLREQVKDFIDWLKGQGAL
jgi:hypothetical protein